MTKWDESMGVLRVIGSMLDQAMVRSKIIPSIRKWFI